MPGDKVKFMLALNKAKNCLYEKGRALRGEKSVERSQKHHTKYAVEVWAFA